MIISMILVKTVRVSMIRMMMTIMMTIISRILFTSAVRSSLQAMCATSSPSYHLYFFSCISFVAYSLSLSLIVGCHDETVSGVSAVTNHWSFIIYHLSLIISYSLFTASHLKISCLEFEDKNSIRNLNSFNEIFNFHNWYRSAHVQLQECHTVAEVCENLKDAVLLHPCNYCYDDRDKEYPSSFQFIRWIVMIWT